MATIRLCDWFKTRIAKDEETFKVMIGEEEFEVSEEGFITLIDYLKGEEPPEATRTVEVEVEVEKIVYRDAPLDATMPVIDMPVSDDPFSPGPSSMPQPPQAGVEPEPAQDLEPIQIPEDVTKRLRPPTKAQAEEVIRTATKFEQGSLPALTVGGKAQREASRKLRAVETKQAEALQRRGKSQGGFNVGDDVTNKPGYSEE